MRRRAAVLIVTVFISASAWTPEAAVIRNEDQGKEQGGGKHGKMWDELGSAERQKRQKNGWTRYTWNAQFKAPERGNQKTDKEWDKYWKDHEELRQKQHDEERRRDRGHWDELSGAEKDYWIEKGKKNARFEQERREREATDRSGNGFGKMTFSIDEFLASEEEDSDQAVLSLDEWSRQYDPDWGREKAGSGSDNSLLLVFLEHAIGPALAIGLLCLTAFPVVWLLGDSGRRQRIGGVFRSARFWIFVSIVGALLTVLFYVPWECERRSYGGTLRHKSLCYGSLLKPPDFAVRVSFSALVAEIVVLGGMVAGMGWGISYFLPRRTKKQ